MPLFTFICPEEGCEHEIELIVNTSESKADVGAAEACPEHDKALVVFEGGESAHVHPPHKKGGVVLKNGARVQGEFVRRG